MDKDLRTSIFRYCDYQERCHQEVRNKLFELGADADLVDSMIAELIQENLLNEERYARSFTRGRFNLKKWGRNKIMQELKQNRVSDYCIKLAMQEIDSEAYSNTLSKLAEQKWNELERDSLYIRRGKVIRYLLQKGFEMDLIQDCIARMQSQ